MTFQYSVFNRFISIMLILLIVFMCVFTVTIQADAFVLSATSSAVILTILAACGIYGLGSLTDADALVYDFQKSLSAEAKAELDKICDGFVIGATFRLGAALLESVSSYCESLPISGDYVTVPANTLFSCGSFDLSSFLSPYNVDDLDKLTKYSISEFPLSNFLLVDNRKLSNSYYSYFYIFEKNGVYNLCTSNLKNFTDFVVHSYDSYNHSVYRSNITHFAIEYNGVYKYLQFCFFDSSGSQIYATAFYFDTLGFALAGNPTLTQYPVSYGNYTAATVPINSTYLPAGSNPLTTDTSISVPQGLVNEAGEIDAGVLEGMTAEDVRVSDTVTDVPEDGGFLASIAAGVTGILEAITGFFDVSRFELDLSPLKIGLTDVFPFCIPFDFFNSIKQFASPASDFTFDINLHTEFFDIDHTVDLQPFRIPILFFRYVVTFWFTYILISKTRDFIKW